MPSSDWELVGDVVRLADPAALASRPFGEYPPLPTLPMTPDAERIGLIFHLLGDNVDLTDAENERKQVALFFEATSNVPDYVLRAVALDEAEKFAPRPRWGLPSTAELFLRLLAFGGERPDQERVPHAAVPLVEVFPPRQLPAVVRSCTLLRLPFLTPDETPEMGFAVWVKDEAARLMRAVAEGRLPASDAPLELVRAFAAERKSRGYGWAQRPAYAYVRLDKNTDWRLVRESERQVAASGICPEPMPAGAKEPRRGNAAKENAGVERLWTAWPVFWRHVLYGEAQPSGDRGIGRLIGEIIQVANGSS